MGYYITNRLEEQEITINYTSKDNQIEIPIVETRSEVDYNIPVINLNQTRRTDNSSLENYLSL